MEPDDRQSLLWKLSENVREESSEVADLEPVDDATLRAYGQGELPAAQRELLEQRLMIDSDCRRRLAELRGVGLPPAPAHIRRHLIERFAGRAGARRRPQRAWRRLGVLPVAAAIVAAVGVAFLLRPSQPPLDVPSYEVSLQGLSERRGAGAGTDVTEVDVYADTPVVIDAVATERAVDGIEVGLYRPADGGLQRLTGSLERQERQGAVRFTVPASQLVGPAVGRYELFVVIGPVPLPAELAMPERGGPEGGGATTRDSGRQIHRLLLRLKTPDPPPDAGGPTPDD